MKKSIIAIGCSIALGLGVLAYKADDIKTSISNIKNSINKQGVVITHLDGITNLLTAKVYIHEASKSLEEGLKHHSLWYLETALGKKNVELKQNVNISQVEELAEKIVDIYGKYEAFKEDLLYLAKSVHKAKIIETATNNLQTLLETVEKEQVNRYYWDGGDQGLCYHLWLIYNLELKETKDVDNTHENIREYYKKSDPFDYLMVKDILKKVEESLPKGDSELIKKIENYKY